MSHIDYTRPGIEGKLVCVPEVYAPLSLLFRRLFRLDDQTAPENEAPGFGRGFQGLDGQQVSQLVYRQREFLNKVGNSFFDL